MAHTYTTNCMKTCGEKPYKSGVGGTGFTSNCQREEHSGENPYKCEVF